MAQKEDLRTEPDEGKKARLCALCGREMVLQGRDPLVRCLGLVLLYAAAALLLIWAPALGPDRAACAGIIGVCGCVLMRNTKRFWCPGCWFAEP